MSILREFLLRLLLRKEVNVMAVVYATLIVKGLKTLEQVPSLIREDVRQLLVDLGGRGVTSPGERSDPLPFYQNEHWRKA